MDNDLLEMKENIVNPIEKFLNGAQRKIFDDASFYLNENSSNFNIVGKNLANEISNLLSDQNCFKNNKMQQVTQKLNELQTLLKGELSKKRDGAIKILGKLETDLKNNSDFLNADEDKKVIQIMNFRMQKSIENEKIIP